MRNVIDGHAAPPPVLVLERGRSNRDALAADVVQNVDLVRERSAGEDLEHLERRLERRVGAPFHEALDRGTPESLHRALLVTRPRRAGCAASPLPSSSASSRSWTTPGAPSAHSRQVRSIECPQCSRRSLTLISTQPRSWPSVARTRGAWASSHASRSAVATTVPNLNGTVATASSVVATTSWWRASVRALANGGGSTSHATTTRSPRRRSTTGPPTLVSGGRHAAGSRSAIA